MSKNLTPICVRLHPDTLRLLDKLVRRQNVLQLDRRTHAHSSPYNRSALLRHAITAGLDVLTDQPALKL